MNAVTEQIDRQADERFRKAGAADSHDVADNRQDRSTTNHNEARGAQIVQNNQLSTPVAIAAIVCFLIAGILGGLAIGIANTANDKAGQARMEARLAQEDLMMLRAAVKARGIDVETSHDHD